MSRRKIAAELRDVLAARDVRIPACDLEVVLEVINEWVKKELKENSQCKLFRLGYLKLRKYQVTPNIQGQKEKVSVNIVKFYPSAGLRDFAKECNEKNA